MSVLSLRTAVDMDHNDRYIIQNCSSKIYIIPDAIGFVFFSLCPEISPDQLFRNGWRSNALASIPFWQVDTLHQKHCLLACRLKAGEIPLEEQSEDPEKKVTYLMPAMDFHQRRHEAVLQEAADMDLVLDGKKVVNITPNPRPFHILPPDTKEGKVQEGC